MLSRYGVPDVLVTNNGPQFASTEFAGFAKTFGFEHVTSSPQYPQSNGKAENAVKMVKRLFSKCKDTGQSEFLAPGLAQHTHRRNRHKPCSAILGLALQYPLTHDRITFGAIIPHKG